MILLKQADVYAPEHLGIKDVLVCGGKIEAVGDNLEDVYKRQLCTCVCS